jgi:hypothetical protein
MARVTREVVPHSGRKAGKGVCAREVAQESALTFTCAPGFARVHTDRACAEGGVEQKEAER